MKVFLFTSNKFSGEWEFEYDDLGRLSKCENRSDMGGEALLWLHKNFPVQIKALDLLKFKNSEVTEVTDITFEMFYERYAKKNNPSRAKTAWNRLSKKDKLDAFMGIYRYNYDLQLNPRTKQYPASYLNARVWESEFDFEIKRKENKVADTFK